MTIQDWGAVGEIVGAIAVLLTLIYLALQIRQNTISQRAHTHWMMVESMRDDNRIVLERPELELALRKARLAPDDADLDDTERGLIYFYTMLLLLRFQGELYQNKLGLLAEDQFRDRRDNLIRGSSIRPEWVLQISGVFPEDTQAEIEAIVEARRQLRAAGQSEQEQASSDGGSA